MAEMMFWSFAVRFLTSLVQASPIMLVGFAVAAILRRFFGSEETRRLFGEGTRSALFRAWAERYEVWTRKQEVGSWLRHREMSDYHRWKTRLLREQLEVLEHEVEDSELEEVTLLRGRLFRSHARMRRAFTEEL